MKMMKRIVALALAVGMTVSALPAWAEETDAATTAQTAPVQENAPTTGVELEGRWASLEELLENGVITQETHDAIRVYLEKKEPVATTEETTGKTGRGTSRQGRGKTGTQENQQTRTKQARKSAAQTETGNGQQPPELPDGDMSGQQPPELPDGDASGQQPPELPDGDMSGQQPAAQGPGGMPFGQERNGQGGMPGGRR